MNVLLSVYMLIMIHAEYYTWSGNLHVVLSVDMLIVIHGVVYMLIIIDEVLTIMLYLVCTCWSGLMNLVCTCGFMNVAFCVYMLIFIFGVVTLMSK